MNEPLVNRSRLARDLLLLGCLCGMSAIGGCDVYDGGAVGAAEGADNTPLSPDQATAGAPAPDEEPHEQTASRDGGLTDEAAFHVTECVAQDGSGCAADHAIAACQDGACLIVECADGYRDCDGYADNGCEVAPDDADHCGVCGESCRDLPQATARCEAGSCAVVECRGNFGDCNRDAADGCETPLDTLRDCGACGAQCDRASCAGGVCSAVSCADEAADCDGDGLDCEADLSADANHCGGCGLACAFRTETPHAALACAGGGCVAVCEPGYGDCDGEQESGCEAPLATAPKHCGACGNDCAELPHTAETSCTDGRCGVVSCASGFQDCDDVAANGCERNVAADGPCLPEPDCAQQTHDGREYLFCTSARTWASARARCMQLAGGDLVNIGSDAENEFVAMNCAADTWIGAADMDNEGRWRWVDDAQIFWRGAADGSAQPGQYANWRAGQPDDTSDEDCAEIAADGAWADAACSAQRGFVCEFGPAD